MTEENHRPTAPASSSETAVKTAELRRRIAAAVGEEPADLVIRNVKTFSLCTGEILPGDIAVAGGVIAGIGSGYRGREELDGANSIVVPGFIDSHCHIESTLLTPFEFEPLALSHGVTTAICDPHELANVAGTAAIEWFLAVAEGLHMTLFVQIPSCVPATRLESNGADLPAEAIAQFRWAERSRGLAEMMNVPGVLGRDPGVLEKLALWADANIDGHAPLLSGRCLDGVLAAGIRNCHECSSLKEAREKLARGMNVLIREGSAAHNLEALAPLLTIANSPFLSFCCDDRNSLDWRREGGIDFMVRRALALGCEPLAVYRAASWSGARMFGLADRGLVAPGRRADLILLESLDSGVIRQVICGGIPVSDGKFPPEKRSAEVPETFVHSIHLDPVTATDFRIVSNDPDTPVIGLVERQIITEHLHYRLEIVNGEKRADPGRDILKAAVFARHGRNHNVGRGFVKGFGLKRGAFASSVGHDSHNLCVTGTNDHDMAVAVNALIASQGGYAVVADGRVIASLALEVGGLMSSLTHEEITDRLEEVFEAVRALGCVLEDPFESLAFLPLPVIPHLRLTDLGLVDVDAFRLIDG